MVQGKERAVDSQKQGLTNSQTQTAVRWLPEGKGVGGTKRVKGAKYMMTEGDQALGDKPTGSIQMLCYGVVHRNLQNVLTNVTSNTFN